jgi:DNA-binding transcriptional regulator GbsR (MarR family)
MQQGDRDEMLVPEGNGTKGGSLSLKVSMPFKETDAVENGQAGARIAALTDLPAMAGADAGIHADPVAALESEAVQMFISVARCLGYPRSVGEILGVLFAAEEPLSFEAIATRRGISAGSLSVGLRHLRNLGVVVTKPLAGERRDYFMVNEDFAWVSTSLVHYYIEPRVSAAERRTNRIRMMAEALDQGGRHPGLATRLHRFVDWQTQVVRLITPLLKSPQ